MKFEERLRELRLQKGLTLRDLAEKVGLNFTYLSKIENGKLEYTPSADKIREIARALGVDEIELLKLANKVPTEMKSIAQNTAALAFFRRAKDIASTDDWRDLLEFLDNKHKERIKPKQDKG